MWRIDEQLHRSHATLVLTRDETLRDDRAQILRQVQEDLRVLIQREHIDDAIERFRGVVRVQRRQHEMARTGQHDRGLHRFSIADLADQQHVRRRTHRTLQCTRIRLGIEADFALIDDRLLVRVQELDRIFDRDDVVRRVLVAIVDHRRERGRLARAGGTDHEDHAALHHHQVFENVWQTQIVETRHIRGDIAQHHRGIAALVKDVHPEAAETRL